MKKRGLSTFENNLLDKHVVENWYITKCLSCNKNWKYRSFRSWEDYEYKDIAYYKKLGRVVKQHFKAKHFDIYMLEKIKSIGQ